MAADPSIYSLIQQPKLASPMETYGGALQIKSLVDQQALQELQRKQLLDADAENQRVRDLFAGGRTPTEAQAIAASPKFGMGYAKTLLENKRTQSEIDRNNVVKLKDTVDLYRNALGSVNDQMAFSSWRANFIKELPQFAGSVPEQFSVDVKRDLLLKGDELGKQLMPRFEIVDLGGQKVSIDMNPVTNPAIKGTKFDKTVTPGEQLGADTTRRGQDMTQATAQRGQDISARTTERGQDMTDLRERDVDLQGRVTAAREGAKNSVEAQAALPQVQANAERGLRLIDEMVGSADGKVKPHPGFQSAVGVSLSKMMSPFWAPPGTDRRDFDARMDEIKGGAFMEAFQSLKGGGQITEAEGRKATQAITRMDSAQSEREFVKAAREFQDIIKTGLKRAQQKAGPRAAAAPQRDSLGGVLTRNADGSFSYGF